MLGLKDKNALLRSQLVLLRLKSGVFNVSYLYYLIERSKVHQVLKTFNQLGLLEPFGNSIFCNLLPTT
jgi:hypothetical protein